MERILSGVEKDLSIFGVALNLESDLHDETSSYDNDEVVRRRARSLLSEGQISPILVCEAAQSDDLDNEGARYVVVAGRTRLAAARLILATTADNPNGLIGKNRGFAGLEDVENFAGLRYEVVARPENALGVVMAENVERTSKSTDERAKLAVRLHKFYSQTSSEDVALKKAAYKLDVSEQTVRSHLQAMRLAEREPTVKEGLALGAISMADVAGIAKKETKAVYEGKVDEAEKLVNELKDRIERNKQTGKTGGKKGKRGNKTPGAKARTQLQARLEIYQEDNANDDYAQGIADALAWFDGGTVAFIDGLMNQAVEDDDDDDE